MREILFRGKILSQDEHFDDGEWVQGFYACFNGKEHRIYSGYAETDCGDYYPDWCNVRPETLGQFTGLTDKNGTKIFEGDIVRTQEMYDRPYSKNRKSKKHIGVVEYKIHSGSGFYNHKTGKWDRYAEWEAEWVVKVNDYGKFVHSSWGDFYDCEIIGNIHDNSELLGTPQNDEVRE